MQHITRPSYEPEEWTTRQAFVRMVNSVCAARDIEVAWSSGDWMATLRKNKTTTFIYGYTFPLNNAAVAGVLRDKSAAYQVLTAAGVPAIPHFLLRLNALRATEGVAAEIQKIVPLPVVIKPNMGENGGFDVTRSTTAAELETAVRDLATRHRHVAASPFMEISREFRVVMLADKPLLMFEKVRGSREWRHNLRLGAAPRQVDYETALRLTSLAERAMKATRAQLAAVDIVETPDGYKIMELNGGISLGSFAKHSATYAERAVDVYDDIIRNIFSK